MTVVTRAVIFDFGNVLCFPPAPEKIELAARLCGLRTGDFWERFWRERLEYDAGLLEPLQYWSGIVGPDFAQAHLPELIRHEVEFWNDYDPRPFHWIERLRTAGIRVGMLSNLPRVLGEALRRERFLERPFLEHFDHVTFSFELRCVKPQAPVYRHAWQGLGVAPEEALLLDDKLPNVHGAIEAGLQAEHFTDWTEFLARGVPSLYGLPEAAH